MLQNTPTRPAFVEAFPHLSAEHRSAQCAFFAAATNMDLSRDRALQIRGVNEALGLRGTNRIQSRRELTVGEMQLLTVAIEAGLFEDDWTWGNDFTVTVRVRMVPVNEIHIQPRAVRSQGFAA